jgi:hypothetical protein
MMAGFLIRGVRDMPYIINRQPRTATVETLTGISGGIRSSRAIFVRNIDTGEVFQIQVSRKPIEAGEIYHIEYLPNTGWASFIGENEME